MPTAADYMPIIVRVLNSTVVEDFDCGLLHVEEAKEVLLSVYAKWWGNTLTGYKYLLNPDIGDEEKLLANENISVADISIAAIAAVTQFYCVGDCSCPLDPRPIPNYTFRIPILKETLW